MVEASVECDAGTYACVAFVELPRVPSVIWKLCFSGSKTNLKSKYYRKNTELYETEARTRTAKSENDSRKLILGNTLKSVGNCVPEREREIIILGLCICITHST